MMPCMVRTSLIVPLCRRTELSTGQTIYLAPRLSQYRTAMAVVALVDDYRTITLQPRV